MKLPAIDQPIHTVDLLGIGKKRFRPFTVKEQKLMMMAVESNELSIVIDCIKQIISNCCLDPIDVDAMPLIDIEMFFMNLRARSMGEMLNVFFKCNNEVGEVDPETNKKKECGMVIEVEVDLLKVPIVNKNYSKQIKFSDDLMVTMKYPTFELIDKLSKSETADTEFAVVAACIDQIIDKESVYDAKDATDEELEEFVDNLPSDKYDMLSEFVVNLPKARLEEKKKCPKCGFEHNLVLEGLNDFFI